MTPLVEPEKCLLFSDHTTALSYSAITSSQATNNTITSPIIKLIEVYFYELREVEIHENPILCEESNHKARSVESLSVSE